MESTRETASQRAMEKILEAAERCIGQKGYQGATMQDIAEEAGVSKALVHYHFHSKEHLLLEVQARAYRRVAEVVAELAASGTPSLRTTFAALDRVWEMLVAFRDQVPFSLELWSQATRRPELQERLDRFNEEMVALIRHGLKTTAGAEERTLPLPGYRLARMLFPLLSGLALHAYFCKDRAAVDTAYRDFRTILERALLPATAEGAEDKP
jgi:AcrR family transcriptional regulator